MYNSPGIHFKVMLVLFLNRHAILTFFGSPLRRRRNSDSVQFNHFNSAATLQPAGKYPTVNAVIARERFLG